MPDPRPMFFEVEMMLLRTGHHKYPNTARYRNKIRREYKWDMEISNTREAVWMLISGFVLIEFIILKTFGGI